MAESESQAPAAEPAGIARHFTVAELGMTALEAAFVAVPLFGLFDSLSSDEVWLVGAAIPLLATLEGLWLLALAFWLAPLKRAAQWVRRGERPTPEIRDAAYHSSLRLPLRALVGRTLVWVVLGGSLGAWLVWNRIWVPRRAAEMASAAGMMALACNVVRVVWYGRLLARARARLFHRLGDIRLFADRYRSDLATAVLAVNGAAVAAAMAFLYYSRAVTRLQFLELILGIPVFAIVLVVGWTIFARWALRDVSGYLARATGQGEPDRPVQVYRRAQILPVRLATFNMATWVGMAVVAIVFARAQMRFELDDAVLLFGTLVVIGIGTSLYALLCFRELFRPVLEHLTVEHRLPVRSIRSGFSLRAKLLTSFGGLVLFACSLALFWGFIQYKSLVSASVANQADLGLAWLRSEAQAAVGSERPSPAMVRTVLANADTRGPEVNAVLYYFPADPGEPVTVIGGGPMGAPSLPWYARAKAETRRDGWLQVAPLALLGRHGQLTVRWRGELVELGSLAVLIPNYRARGPSIFRPLKELLAFFLVLFGACAGIVLLTVSQVVGPIRKIEERADQMARGELAQPVSSAGEGDEVGRLTFALEEMRRALRDKLRSTEEVNLDLERAVQRRTADLAKKNRELAETLQKLTLAQNQLVRAEKMASIGQLVAGIAHEINNPVNAIVNTVGPLREALDDANSADPMRKAEATEDIGEMLRVVQNGAQRTKAIVQALHNYSRTDDESLVAVDVNRTIDDSLELLRHITKQSIAIERDFGEVGRVQGHPGQLGQVIMNLLTNAAQALGGRDGATITIETRGDDAAVVVIIRDNGPGIPSEVLGRIFDPFFTTKDVGEGSGLGLSIVHGIVERHGGTIEVESTVGAGTTFTITLPRQRAAVA